MLRRHFLLAALASAALSKMSLASEMDTKQRRSADRPTALPENKNLADQFAGAAAGYTTQVRIQQAAGKDTAKLVPLANWLYFNAIDLSDKAFAKRQFIAHLRELSELNEEVNRAAAERNNEKLTAAANALAVRLNQRLEEGERLFAEYEKAFNTVVQNPDGSFTVHAK